MVADNTYRYFVVSELSQSQEHFPFRGQQTSWAIVPWNNVAVKDDLCVST